MYDIMSTTYNAYRGGAAMMAAASTAAAASGYSMTAYGLAMTYSSAAGFTFAFDPTSFAVAVAILIVVELTSCEKAEKELAQKNGAGLCRQYSSSCNGFFCTSVTRRYCCFNSKLAKIINTAAVAQIGRANSDCTGLTMAEFGMLNFAAIDLGEFTAEIMANIQLPSTGAIGVDVNAAIQKKLTNYYTTGKQ
jgi:conjugal transfer mating pair stabilization protein TraN